MSKTSIVLIFMAGIILWITSGVRMSLGLFVKPMESITLDIVSISFALAVCQLMWGIAQPIAGALGDKFGARWVLISGTILLILGCALTPFLATPLGLIFSIGLLIAFGTGAGSFSLLMGQVANRIEPQYRGVASGIINASSSFGQFSFALMLQPLIAWRFTGWQGAMWAMAGISLLMFPVAWWITRGQHQTLSPSQTTTPQTAEQSLGETVKIALKDKSYLLIHLAFFTCGFHIAFLATHLPMEITLAGLKENVASWSLALIGLSNVIGSLFIGWCVGHYRSKYILFWMYLSRAVMIAIFLIAPKTTMTFYIFAIALGLTWLATVPPTASAVGKLFGVRYLATLFGLTLVSHQIGAFFGAYFGGLAIQQFGDYQLMWYADIILAVLAGVANLPIREPKIEK
ncbi:MFS transporter [Moraxella sp. ZY210820]|uniref:MFS transporter n=1 Tax=unclassified Moraxella TaxID=2685852 RepID=UPI00272F9A71|nr:MFS transporter [Moraxella sp. ZY210820]WLF84475.1 MFS transporter [Moraxella sp. ZY210820]